MNQIGVFTTNFFSIERSMSVRLGKDERAALIAEFEQGKQLSNPNYYCVKDKNGKIMLRKVKEPKQPLSESESEFLKINKAMKVIQSSMAKLQEAQPPRPVSPVPENNKPTTKEPKPHAL